MGSSSSRMGRCPSEYKPPKRTRRLLSSLVCGASTSQSPSEMEEYPAKSLVNSVENLAAVTDELCSSRADSSSDSGFNSSKTELVVSSGSSTGSIEDNFSQNGLRNIQASNPGECLLKSKEAVSHQENGKYYCKEAYISKNSATASTSYKEQPYVQSASANLRNGLDAAAEPHDSARIEASLICPEDINSGSVAQEQLTGNSAESNDNAITGIDASASGSLSVLPDSLLSLQLFGDNTAQALPSAAGFLMSDSDRDLRSGSVLQVDVVSITSNILASSSAEISNREARRNSRRLFWDALSRRSFRRHSDSPTIVFTTGHAVDLGSRDRWLLDLSGDLHYDGVGHEFEYMGTRRHRRNDRRWQLRSEMLDRNRSGPDGGGRLCPSGLHPDGTCACDSYFMGEESSTFTSITRIVMLSEALFEVLDGIHHQPSTLSVPAPESVVNSFPLKNHKMSSETESERSDVKQCYICLVEYEEGDEIRVLPCHHEYHMTCVDKWLKEIHGVCPLCRCNVCEGISRGSTSNSEIPSH